MSNTEDLLRTSYYYDLPENFISQKPAEPRDTSKLMVINREKNSIEHKKFRDILDFVNSGDTIVLNNTRVIPARLHGRKNGEGAFVEVFLVREVEKDTWLTLAKPGKRLKNGTRIVFPLGLEGFVKETLESGEKIISFVYDNSKTFMEIIKEIGELPLPPYITKPECDEERYQTVYSEKEGSVAAPTAGLHFTTELIDSLKNKGVNIVYITLHVGLGTFLPVKTDNILEHKMHEEYYEISKETAEILNKTLNENKNLIAVGTTVTRTLETVVNKLGKFEETRGFSDIFMYPSYKFKAVKTLITNFHLPESTLIMLVSAFWNRERVLNAYEVAKENGYKFYSLGDSMILF